MFKATDNHNSTVAEELNINGEKKIWHSFLDSKIIGLKSWLMQQISYLDRALDALEHSQANNGPCCQKTADHVRVERACVIN